MYNPLQSYRRVQRELRRHFESFTRQNCPACPTPCCRRPARILPTDILLAESTGWRDSLPRDASVPAGDMATEIAGRMADAMYNPPESAEASPDAPPCEYLGDRGCTFPADLRPFGCTAYICRYMLASMDRSTLNKIKRLVRELEEHHRHLLRTIQAGGDREDNGKGRSAPPGSEGQTNRPRR